MIRWSDSLCNSCKELAEDILSGKTHLSPRWRTLRSYQAALSQATCHLDGTVAALLRSGKCCPFCDRLMRKVSKFKERTMEVTEHYILFLWKEIPEECELQIALGSIQTFLGPVSQKPVPESLMFWSIPRTLHTFPVLGDRSSGWIASHPRLLRFPEPSLGSTRAYRQVRLWLKECQEDHELCIRPPGRLPKRVLDLGRGKALDISLKIVNGVELEDYVALSYSWGSKTPRLVTNRRDPKTPGEEPQYPMGYVLERKIFLGRLKSNGKPKSDTVSCWSPVNIPLDIFPQTLKEGIQIAKNLGFRYIWIDALCILQNDEKDWGHQSAAMTEIYGNSTMTISATSNEQSDEEILRSLPSDGLRIGGWTEPDGKLNDILVGDRPQVLDLEEKYLSTRGWVFQERLVSPATLHYTDGEMAWECAHGTHSDRNRDVYNVKWKAQWRSMLEHSVLDHVNGQMTRSGQSDPYKIWYEWICAYAARSLFDSEDKFPAIAGVAKKFAERIGLDGCYVAGLWKNDFRAGLLWRRHHRVETLKPLRDKYIAPSWSWASVEGRLEYRLVTWCNSRVKGPNLEIVAINVVEKQPLEDRRAHGSTYGKLIRGSSVTVRGCLQEVTVNTQSRPGAGQRQSQACGMENGFINNTNVECTLDFFPPNASLYNCWCLRIGTYVLQGDREADVFLLLERVSESKNTFRRVGFAEAREWFSLRSPTPNSGLLRSHYLKEVILE